MEQFETPNCNFCGSTKEQHKLIKSNVKDTKHDMVECNVCNLRFYSPRTAWTTYLERGYGTWEGSKKEADFMYQNANFTRVTDRDSQIAILKSYYGHTFIDKMFKLRPNIAAIYEIGGNVGWFSYFIKQRNSNIAIDGCEVNKFAVDIANREFGLNYSTGTFLDTPIPEGKLYDVVVALDVIEHVFTPYNDLKKMSSITKIGGLLLLKTFLEELDVNRTMEAPIGHSHHFFGHVLRSMIEKSGFKIISWEEEGIMVNLIAEKI